MACRAVFRLVDADTASGAVLQRSPVVGRCAVGFRSPVMARSRSQCVVKPGEGVVTATMSASI
jgi:hypothetical protein